MRSPRHFRRSRAVLFFALAISARNLHAEDCNANGVEDARDLSAAFRLRSSVKWKVGLLGPSAAALVDADGDGDPDLVMGVGGSGEVDVLFNDGQVGFFPSGSYTASSEVRSIAAADLDGDGDPDLATADFDSGVVSVFRNQADGTFAAAEGIAAPAPKSNPSALRAADLDGDGDVDLAVAVDFYDPGHDDLGVDPGYVLVLLNDGAGTFSVAAGEAPSTRVRPVAIAVGDIDGNGAPDIAVANNFTGSVTVLLNGGGGSFKPADDIEIERPRSVTLADFDKDFDADLIVAGDSRYMALLSAGDGRFTPALDVEGPFYTAQATAATDVNFDGNLDACVGVGRAVLVHIGNGHGTFEGGSLSFATGVEAPASIDAGDVDGDGDLDLALLSKEVGASSVLILVNDDGRGFVAPANQAVGHLPTSLAVTDFDADERLDVVVANSSVGTASVLLGAAVGGLTEGSLLSAGDGNFSLVARDLDGDEQPDVAVGVAGSRSNPASQIMVFWNRVDGIFETPDYLFARRRPVWIAAADLDGDGALELLAANNDLNEAAVLWNEGDRRFSDPFSTATGELPWFITAEDLDGDGRLDLITSNDRGQVSYIRNEGDRMFKPVVQVAAGSGEAFPLNVAAGDFDGDGAIDLAVPHVGPSVGNYVGTVSTFRNRGGASFADPVVYEVGRVPRFVTAADVDGDHDLDLSVACSNAVSVLLNDGSGAFSGPIAYASGGSEPDYVALADMDRDGDLDFVVANSLSDDVSVITNESTPPASLDLNRNGVPDECEGRPFHRGDPNGDGAMNISDAVVLLGYLFQGRGAPGCLESADADNNGRVDISDAVASLSFLFQSGPPPAAPGPVGEPCGADTDRSGSPGDLGCGEYTGC